MAKKKTKIKKITMTPDELVVLQNYLAGGQLPKKINGSFVSGFPEKEQPLMSTNQDLYTIGPPTAESMGIKASDPIMDNLAKELNTEMGPPTAKQMGITQEPLSDTSKPNQESFNPTESGLGQLAYSIFTPIAQAIQQPIIEKRWERQVRTAKEAQDTAMNMTQDPYAMQYGNFQQQNYGNFYQMGGSIEGMPNSYDGAQSHQGPTGGVPVDRAGRPSVVSREQPVARTEDGEVSFNFDTSGAYVFSDTLKDPGTKKTYAEEAKTIMNKHKKRLGKNFNLDDEMALEAMTQELSDVARRNEISRMKNEAENALGVKISLPKKQGGGETTDPTAMAGGGGASVGGVPLDAIGQWASDFIGGFTSNIDMAEAYADQFKQQIGGMNDNINKMNASFGNSTPFGYYPAGTMAKDGGKLPQKQTGGETDYTGYGTTWVEENPVNWKPNYGAYAGGLANTLRGLFEKAEYVDPGNYMMPMNYKPVTYRGEEQAKALRDSMYNAMRAGAPSSPTSNVAQKYVANTQYRKGLAQLSEQLRNANTQEMARANALNQQIAAQNIGTRMNIDEINRQNRAAKTNMLTQGLSELMQAGQMQRQEKNTYDLINKMYPQRKQYLTDPDGNVVLDANGNPVLYNPYKHNIGPKQVSLTNVTDQQSPEHIVDINMENDVTPEWEVNDTIISSGMNDLKNKYGIANTDYTRSMYSDLAKQFGPEYASSYMNTLYNEDQNKLAKDVLPKELIDAYPNLGDLTVGQFRDQFMTQDNLLSEFNGYTYDGEGYSDYLDVLIGKESSGDPNAKNDKSTATGLTQFVEDTWMDMMKQYRPDLYNKYSREQLLSLRNNPGLSRELAARYAQHNAKILDNYGIEPTPGNLYLAHHFGAGGAGELLGANPNAKFEDVMPENVVEANPTYKGMTVEEVINKLTEPFSDVTIGNPSIQNNASNLSFNNTIPSTTNVSGYTNPFASLVSGDTSNLAPASPIVQNNVIENNIPNNTQSEMLPSSFEQAGSNFMENMQRYGDWIWYALQKNKERFK